MAISVCRAEVKSNWQKKFTKIRRENFEKIISRISTYTGLNAGGGPQVRAPGCPSQGDFESNENQRVKSRREE